MSVARGAVEDSYGLSAVDSADTSNFTASTPRVR